jgi:hypothetical protein
MSTYSTFSTVYLLTFSNDVRFEHFQMRNVQKALEQKIIVWIMNFQMKR